MPWRFQPNQSPWNKGTGGCKKGHDPSLYKKMRTGEHVCLACKRINGRKYRHKDIKQHNFKNRVGRYSMSIDIFKDIWSKQNGCCTICGTVFNDANYRIDHNHETGKVRGILCTSCNTGIGLLKDSPQILLQASEYLKNHGS